MTYKEKLTTLTENPEQLEAVYQAALTNGEDAAFKQAIDEVYAAAPDNLLMAAWFHRLKQTAAQAKEFVIAWSWAIPLALLNGLIFWILSDDMRFVIRLPLGNLGTMADFLPWIILLAAPIAALLVIIYLAAASFRPWPSRIALGLIPLLAAVYVFATYPQTGTIPFQEQYLTLMILHLALLSWLTVGAFLIYFHRDSANRFAVLIKSLEVGIMGGLFAIAGGIFTGITVGLFAALDVDFPTVVQRLFFAGGGGLIPVLAVAVIYNPAVPPAAQSFQDGLSKLIGLLMRILLPLTLLVLLVYVAFIPFNFWEPFDNRDVLIIYNGMLFAVIALLVGVTPVQGRIPSPQLAKWLRWGIIAVAALALLVSLYAFSAIVYRTAIDRLTPNRLTFIGWNAVNIGLLVLVLFWQFKGDGLGWTRRLTRAYSVGTVAYAGWTVAVILLLPWLFGVDQGQIDNLPPAVQQIVWQQPEPILLKCEASPHIYLLQDGQKRWIQDIDTFDERGYQWREVKLISCDDLRSIEDGPPIPADAGEPPQP